MKRLILLGLSACMIATTPITAEAGRHYQTRHHHHWSRKAKGTAIGAASGAVIGGVAHGGKGAVVGGVVGAGTGYLIGRHKDRKHGRIYR